ncbi:MAG: DUF1573 domain-containing protein, partial [Candidatus Melainabacteria bacterium]|nr:DUF1573 domain-containing protein [Candidatus Melainabacteria bacterium]
MLKLSKFQRNNCGKIIPPIQYVIAFACTLVMLSLSTVAADQSGTPNIQFDSQVFDFGTVDEGARINHTFKVANKGNGTLKIVDA